MRSDELAVAHALLEDLGVRHVHLVLDVLLGEVESVAERNLPRGGLTSASRRFERP